MIPSICMVAPPTKMWLCLPKTLSAAENLEFLPDGVKTRFSVRLQLLSQQISEHRGPELVN